MQFFSPPQALTIPAGTGWRTVSVAAYVAAGSTGVILLWNQQATATNQCEVRKTGSTDSYTGPAIPQSSQLQLITGLNGSLQFDLYSIVAAGGAGSQLWLLAAFGSEATFNTNLTNVVATTSTYYGVHDLSATAAAGAQAAIVQFVAAPGPMGLRSNTVGATDDFYANSGFGTFLGGFIVGLDATSKFQAKVGNAVNIGLMGYISSGITWNLNGITRTPASADTPTPLNTQANAIGYLYQMYNGSSTYTWQVDSSGTSSLPYLSGPKGSGNVVVAGATPYAQINNTGLAVKELAFFTSTAPSAGTRQTMLLTGVGS